MRVPMWEREIVMGFMDCYMLEPKGAKSTYNSFGPKGIKTLPLDER